ILAHFLGLSLERALDLACGEGRNAVWLAELVCATLPGEPEAWGLLGLLTLQQARARARFDADGSLVLLPDQDRSRWDHRAIASAERYLERAAVWRRPGRFQLHAAIAACHASAPTWAETDWLQILTLYDVLVRYDGSPVIRLNRAVALAEYAGPERALHEVDALAHRLSGYHLLHATRAELLRRLGRTDEATEADREALRLATEPVDRDILSARLAAAQERSAADA
ncbi:MAG TPA: RNA polymerase sigma factor, partial [Dermatophilaceae bacterium]|nr:RNA polymerase sigma factor [Dermatophilaceae bacterium]